MFLRLPNCSMELIICMNLGGTAQRNFLTTEISSTLSSNKQMSLTIVVNFIAKSSIDSPSFMQIASNSLFRLASLLPWHVLHPHALFAMSPRPSTFILICPLATSYWERYYSDTNHPHTNSNQNLKSKFNIWWPRHFPAKYQGFHRCSVDEMLKVACQLYGNYNVAISNFVIRSRRSSLGRSCILGCSIWLHRTH